MRKLRTEDVFAAVRVIKAAGIRERIEEIAEMKDKDVSMERIGVDLLYDVIEGLTTKENEKLLYEFLAKPFEMTAGQVAELEIEDMIEKLRALAKENNLANFFRSVSGIALRK